MNNSYTFTHIADDTELDYSLKMSLPDIIKLVQMSTLMHSDMIGLDHATMEHKSNAFWVTSKIKVALKGAVYSGEKMKIETWALPPQSVRVVRMNEVRVGNFVRAEAISEWCCLDCNTKKIRRMNTIMYPSLKIKEKRELNLSFSREKSDMHEDDYIYTRTIRSSDIDVNRHTNNLKYNLIALDALSMTELTKLNILSYEIHFVNQSYEGDNIRVYKKYVGNKIFIEGRIDGSIIFEVIINYENI